LTAMAWPGVYFLSLQTNMGLEILETG